MCGRTGAALDAHRLAYEVVEEVGVLLLRGNVAGVEDDGQAEREQVIHVALPRRVVEFHLERVPGVVGDRENLGDQVVLGRIRPG